ncbi:MAG: DUF4837 family protein [Ignavibacteria bacterium]|jgi:hypothetical protein
MKKFLLFTFLIVVVLFFQSCEQKKKAIGNEDEIFVIADSVEYYDLEASLLQVFGKIIYTPQPENLFQIRRLPFEKLNSMKRRKNVIIAAPLNSDSQTSNYIESILSPDVKSLIEMDSAFVFNKYDLWAKDQLVMVLTAPSTEKLNEKILGNHENLLHYFQNISNKRLFKSLYNAKYEKKKIEAEILRDHGFIIYVQADFLLAKNIPEDNFVWLRRAVNSDMERWVFVHYIENATPEYLNQDSIASIRNRITKRFYQTIDGESYVEISDNYKTTTEVNFHGRYALYTQGLWRMNDKSMGGPFLSYMFFDEKTNRIYMLDGSLYAPKYKKRKLIQQIDVTLQSFKLEHEVPKDQVEDLLDELDE